MMRGEDSAEIRADLAQQADPTCLRCSGTGVELVPVESPHKLDLNMGNGPALLAALGWSGQYGECPIADARRALLRARNTDLSHLVRADETAYGAPRVQDDGTVAMRPVRCHSRGLTLDGLLERIARFESFVQNAAAAGATEIRWY
jgi:hypothetical protein